MVFRGGFKGKDPLQLGLDPADLGKAFGLEQPPFRSGRMEARDARLVVAADRRRLSRRAACISSGSEGLASATTFDRIAELLVVEGGVALLPASGAIVSPGDVTSLRAAR